MIISIIGNSGNIIYFLDIKPSFLPYLDSFRKIQRWDESHEFEVRSLFVELVLYGFRETFEGRL